MDISVHVFPRPTTSLKPQLQPHAQSQSTTRRTRSALKRRLTTIFGERTGDPNTQNTIGTTYNNSATPHHIHRSAPVSALRHKVSHRRRATLNNPTPSIQRTLSRESPPSYTILAPAPNDRLVVTHPPPTPSSGRNSSNTRARPWNQLYVPPRTSSIVSRQLRTSPSVAELDEGSRTLIYSLYKEQAQRLVRERLAQEQTDLDLALALHLQKLEAQAGKAHRAAAIAT
jgi:hypothetical protein